MNPGHEDCDYETIEEKVLSAREARVTIICLHEHREPLRADDGLGSGPIVADHCQCCGDIVRRADYR